MRHRIGYDTVVTIRYGTLRNGSLENGTIDAVRCEIVIEERWEMNNAVNYSGYSAIKCDAVQYLRFGGSVVRCWAVRFGTVRYDTVR